jgi:tRNA 2-thiouridine synthesizing protein A
MKVVEVNAKGLACPQPVVLTTKALDEIECGEVIVSVTGEVARDNVMRMAESRGCTVSHEMKDDSFILRIAKVSSQQASHRVAAKEGAGESLAYLFDADFIGSNRELGKVLVNGFLNAIEVLPERTSTIVLISTGVKLATSGSYVLETLSKLCDSGFTLLICGTCLDFFNIRDKVRVGTVSNALTIMETLTNADKIVKF